MGGMGGMGGLGGGMDLAALQNMDPATMSAMMQSPMMQQMLSNPAMMQQVIASNPTLAAMTRANPGLLAALSDPNTLRMASDPAMLQQMMRGAGGGVGGGAAIPGMASPFWPPAPSPLLPPRANAGTAPVSATIGGLDFSSLLASHSSQAAPRPFAPALPPSNQYTAQVQQLVDMGFPDRAANLNALIATQGNVNAAVERLLR